MQPSVTCLRGRALSGMFPCLRCCSFTPLCLSGASSQLSMRSAFLCWNHDSAVHRVFPSQPSSECTALEASGNCLEIACRLDRRFIVLIRQSSRVPNCLVICRTLHFLCLSTATFLQRIFSEISIKEGRKFLREAISQRR